MGFGEAIRVCFSKYATFSGRARRAEYWWFVLFGFLVGIITQILDIVLNTGGLISLIVGLGLFLPNLAVTIRRLHDIGKSGWWYLIILIPLIGALILIYWIICRSEPGSNEYGENPLGE